MIQNRITKLLTYQPNSNPITVAEFKRKFKGNIISWRKLQRKLNWSMYLRNQYLLSGKSFLAINPHILAHIPSLIECCEKAGYHEDAKILKKLMDENGGKEYLSIESQNRNESIFQIGDDKSLDGYTISLVIFKEGCLSDMFTLYRVLACGNVPNNQEKRNGYFTPLAEYVRVTVEKYKNIFSAIKIKFDDSRLKDDEFIATCVGYFEKKTYGKHGGLKLSENIDKMYQLGKIPNKKSYNKIFTMYDDFGKHIKLKGNPKFKLGVAHFIFVLFKWMVDKQIKIEDIWKTQFFTNLNEWLRIVQDKEIKQNITFADNLRYKGDDKKLKECLKLGKKFIKNQIKKEYLYQGGSRGKHDRIKLHKMDEKKFLRVNGQIIKNGKKVWFDESKKHIEKIPLTLEDALDSNSVEVEDINPAYKNKNASDYSNKEFATKEYNAFKWKYQPNY